MDDIQFLYGWGDLTPTHPTPDPDLYAALQAAAQAWRDYYTKVDEYYDKPGATTMDVNYQVLDEARNKAIAADETYRKMYDAYWHEHQQNPYDFFGLQ